MAAVSVAAVVPLLAWAAAWMGLTTCVLPWALLLWAGNSLAAAFAASVLTEPLSTVVSLAALLLLMRADRAHRPGYVVVGFALAGLSYWIRSAGLFLRLAERLAQPMASEETLRCWIDRQVPRDAMVAATDGQATGYVLRRPTVSLADQWFSEVAWTEESVRQMMRRFQDFPFLAGLVEGRVPGWLQEAARNRAVIIYSCPDCGQGQPPAPVIPSGQP